MKYINITRLLILTLKLFSHIKKQKDVEAKQLFRNNIYYF